MCKRNEMDASVHVQQSTVLSCTLARQNYGLHSYRLCPAARLDGMKLIARSRE